MSNAIVSNVYRYVIDDVINQVRGDFEDMGIDEAVLQELQRSWEIKVARSRVANFGVGDENYYDEENEEQHGTGAAGTTGNTNNTGINMPGAADGMPHLQYPANAYTAAAASLPTLAAGAGIRPHIPPPHPVQPQQQQQAQQSTDPYNLANRTTSDTSNNNNGQYHLMNPPTTTSQTSKGPDLQLPGGPRPNIPQNDGCADSELTTKQIDAHIEDICTGRATQLEFSATSSSGEAVPLASLPGDIKQLMRDARDRAIKAGAISSKARIPQLDGEGEGGDDDINSDLDDSDDADDDAEGAEEIEHIILCLYDKVTRTKNKWKCVLKDGIMLVNGRDYLFHRANGDFEW